VGFAIDGKGLRIPTVYARSGDPDIPARFGGAELEMCAPSAKGLDVWITVTRWTACLHARPCYISHEI